MCINNVYCERETSYQAHYQVIKSIRRLIFNTLYIVNSFKGVFVFIVDVLSSRVDLAALSFES